MGDIRQELISAFEGELRKREDEIRKRDEVGLPFAIRLATERMQ